MSVNQTDYQQKIIWPS